MCSIKCFFRLKNNNHHNVKAIANINKNNHVALVNSRSMTIDHLTFELSAKSSCEYIAPFCQRFGKFKDEVESTNQSIRHINQFRVDGSSCGWERRPGDKPVSDDVKSAIVSIKQNTMDLLLTFASISNEIELKDCTVTIKNSKIGRTFGTNMR